MNELTEIVEPDIEDLLYEELPEGWSYAKLGQIGKWKGGGTPSKANATYWSGGTIPWVSPKDMKLNRIDDAEDKITDEAVRKSTTNLIEAGSILIVTRSGILRSHVPVAMNSVPVTINQDLKALTVNPNYSAEYILQCLLGFNRLLLMQAGKVGTTVESIDFEALKEFAIRVPPFPEQQKIAAILGKWDEGIEKLQKLIVYKAELKRGLMEQLLTQKKRFKEFAGMAWDRVKLGKVCKKILNGGTPSTAIPEYWQGDIPWITGADFSGQEIKVVRRYISKEAIRNSSTNVVAKGDLLVVTRTGVGKLAIAPFDIAISQDITGLTVDPEKITTSYLFYVLDHQAENFIKQNQGTSIAGITREVLVETEIFVPPLSEQRRIVAVLSAADLELKGLREELILLRQQKTGLMHRLLTRGTGG